jgi:hypothetical protein
MKKFMIFLMLAMCLANFALAQKFNLSAQTTVRSKYVGPEGLSFYPNPVLQTGVTLELKSGLFFDVWDSVGFDGKWSKNWDDEVDYTVGWNGKIEQIN